MGRKCTICNHPELNEINEHLIYQDMTYSDMEDLYGVSRYALYRHKKNHLDEKLKEVRAEHDEFIEKAYLNSIKGLNMIIAKLPELMDSTRPTYTQIIRAIKLKEDLIHSEGYGKELEIQWGDKKDLKEKKEISNKEVEEIEARVEETRSS